MCIMCERHVCECVIYSIFPINPFYFYICIYILNHASILFINYKITVFPYLQTKIKIKMSGHLLQIRMYVRQIVLNWHKNVMWTCFREINFMRKNEMALL